MNKKVIKESELKQLVKDIIKEFAEKSPQAFLGTKSNPVKSGETPKEVKMNPFDGDGTSGKSASVVKVDASSSESNSASAKGKKKANFETKTGPNDKKNELGGKDKGELSFNVDMEENDKEDKDTVPKAFVEAGAGSATGQKKPKISTEAKNEKDMEPIAKGIQLPEGFNKMKFTKTQLQEFIVKEAKKYL